jgi:hypothetical protein
MFYFRSKCRFETESFLNQLILCFMSNRIVYNCVTELLRPLSQFGYIYAMELGVILSLFAGELGLRD